MADAAVAFGDLCTFGQGFGFIGKLDVTAVAAAMICFGVLEVRGRRLGASIFRALIRVPDLASWKATRLKSEGFEDRKYHGEIQDGASSLHSCGSNPNVEVLDASRLQCGQSMETYAEERTAIDLR